MFVAEVKNVCETYHEAPEKAATNNRRTISIDENTGIQAVERKNPTKTIEPGKPERVEFEYIRHGTLSLIANFDVVTGEVVSPSIGDTRNEYDFCKHIGRLISSDPKAQEWVFVADQLNTHQSESLVAISQRIMRDQIRFRYQRKEGYIKINEKQSRISQE